MAPVIAIKKSIDVLCVLEGVREYVKAMVELKVVALFS